MKTGSQNPNSMFVYKFYKFPYISLYLLSFTCFSDWTAVTCGATFKGLIEQIKTPNTCFKAWYLFC